MWAQIAKVSAAILPAAVQGISQGIKSKQARKRAEAAEVELARQKEMFAMLDTSNPYTDMENTMEDLKVNTQQAEFERSQNLQSQANIMDQFRGAAGSSGIASLAQSLAQQGQLQAQKSSVSIGTQESANMLAERKEAARIQGLERQGEMFSRQMEFGKLESQMGMNMADIARERQLQYGLGGQAAGAGQSVE